MSLVDRDLAFMLGGFDSKTVTLGDWSGRAVVDETELMELDSSGEPILVRKTMVRLLRALFVDDNGESTIRRGDAMTINGVAYTVSDVRFGMMESPNAGTDVDGRELHLLVRRVRR